MKEVDLDGKLLSIKFHCSTKGEFFQTLSCVKDGVDGRYWEPKLNAWKAPATKENIRYLAGHDFFISPAVKAFLDPPPNQETIDYNTVKIDEEKLKGLFPYQVTAVKFLEYRKGIAIVGDDMGVGKTMEGLGYLMLHPEFRPALIVCTATGKYVWYDAAIEWLHLKEKDIYVCSGRTPSALPKAQIYIINYDILADWKSPLLKLKFPVAIADEVQYVSNPKIGRTKTFTTLFKSIPRHPLMSGTPIKKRTSQFYTALHLTDPQTFGNRQAFLNRYCDPKFNGFGWTYKGASNTEELHSLIAPLMIRRMKEEVLPDLPPKLPQIVPLECSEIGLKEYKSGDTEFHKWVQDNLDHKNEAEEQNQVDRLKQLAYLAKRNSVMKWISDFLESDRKLVLFSTHLAVLDDIQHEFKDVCVRIDGSTSSKKRKEIEQQFQHDESIRLFIGQIIAAGSVLTLTAASAVAFVELPWGSTDLDQASDRVRRYGQKDCVNVYYLIAKDTIEPYCLDYLDQERDMLSKVLDGKPVDSKMLLGNMLKEYEKRNV